MPQRERIGVHHDDAVGTVASQVSAIILQSPAVFHQDGFRGLGEEAEAQAFENGTVAGLGEYLDIGMTPFGSNGNKAGDQRNGESGGAGLFRYGDALDDVPAETAAGKDFPFVVQHRQIQINFLKSESISHEEVFHLPADGWNAQGQFLYVDPFKWFHHPAGFPILPVPPQIDLTTRR